MGEAADEWADELLLLEQARGRIPQEREATTQKMDLKE
jgi:hypothetical protein